MLFHLFPAANAVHRRKESEQRNQLVSTHARPQDGGRNQHKAHPHHRRARAALDKLTHGDHPDQGGAPRAQEWPQSGQGVQLCQR